MKSSSAMLRDSAIWLSRLGGLECAVAPGRWTRAGGLGVVLALALLGMARPGAAAITPNTEQ
jgi:hypothetical protein